jgi:hypothetical protein
MRLNALPRQLKIDHLGPLTIPVHGLHAMALRYGEEQFSRYGKCDGTFLIAIKTDVLWLEGRWTTSAERMLSYRLIAEFLKASEAHAYSYLSEAYVAQYKAADLDDDDQPDVLPADLPPSERDEVLWVSSFDCAGAGFTSRYLITHRRRGPAFLGPRVDEDADGMSGPALNLFEQEGLL